MKRGANIIIILLSLVLFSCNVEFLARGESVNDYLYPYLEFTLKEDGEGCSVTVVDGAELEEIRIPSAVVIDGATVPVTSFSGFDNPDNAESVRTIILGSSNITIEKAVIEAAVNLETVRADRSEDNAVWSGLPVIEREGYEFDGWYIDGTEVKVQNGDSVIPGYTTLVPRWKEHSLRYNETVNASCMVNGKKAHYRCGSCGRMFSDEKALIEVFDADLVILASHTLVHVEEVGATCTSSGISSHYRCSVCSALFSDRRTENYLSAEDIVLPPKGHVPLLIEAKDATCTEGGNTAYWRCERCNNLYSDEECTAETTVAAATVPSLEHDWAFRYSEKAGEGHWMECTRCHGTKDSTPHSFTVVKSITEPTHETAGTRVLKCADCPAEKTEDIRPVGDHSFAAAEVVPPTCEERGYTVYRCTVPECTSEYKDDYTPSTGHNLDPHEKVNATCTADGVEAYYRCKVCEKYFSDAEGRIIIDGPKTIEASRHRYGNLYIADRTKDVHYRECITCGHHDESQHDYSLEEKEGHAPLVSATCTTGAVYRRSCVCGKEGTETFTDGSGYGHREGEKHDAVPSDCRTQGHKVYYTCSRDCCRNMYYEDENLTEEVLWNDLLLPLANHVYTGGNYDKTASSHTYICDVCHEKTNTESHTKSYEHDFFVHWWKCMNCGYESGTSSHVMTGEKGNQSCDECGYKEKESQNEGGSFHVDVLNLEPEGELSQSRNGTLWTFTLTGTNKNAVPESYLWYVDGSKVAGADTCVYVLSAPENRTYRVMCVFSANGLYSSESVTITGGEEK